MSVVLDELDFDYAKLASICADLLNDQGDKDRAAIFMSLCIIDSVGATDEFMEVLHVLTRGYYHAAERHADAKT